MDEKKINSVGKKKGFIGRLFDKLDKKMEEKSKKSSCGCSDKNKDSACC